MGSHTFTWAHPAQEVYVTGTFDNWAKTVKLEKHGNAFHKTVDLPVEKTFYKFVVDGEWVTDDTANKEQDPSGIVNNVLQTSDIKSAPSSASFLSSAAPQSTTSALAAKQPLEKDVEKETSFPQETPGDDLPGAFPITPMADLQQFSVNPIPATEGPGNPIKLAPGEPVPHPSTLTNHTLESNVRSDPDLNQTNDDTAQSYGVAPIPATAGIGNPIKLAPGEPVPHPSTLTDHTVQSTVRDGSQYGVSDTGAPVLPPVLDSQGEAEANGASMFGIPSVGSGVIPESSLPTGDANRELSHEPSITTSSVAPTSTTALFAGQVPLEPRGVPEVVADSQHAAFADPEASLSSAAVQNKSQVEEELKEKVPEEPSTAESGPTAGVPGVPGVVADSQDAAHVDPEASASPEAVREKAQVEDELKSKVPEESATTSNGSTSIIPEAVAGGAAAAGATLIGAALLAKDKATEVYNASTEPAPSANEVPDIVTESQHSAHFAPEASASPEAVREKAQFEDELKHAVPEAPATSESGLLGNSEAGLTGKIAAGATAAGAAVAGAAYLAKDKAADAYESATGQPVSQITSEPTVDGSVPATVIESQEKAHVDPEASASPLAVREKTAFENELKSEVSVAPATSESSVLGRSEQGISGKAAAGIAAGTAAVSATAAGAAYAARDKAAEATGRDPSTLLPPSIQSAINNMNKGGAYETPATSSAVPEQVVESQHEAHVAPEASAEPGAVAEKSQMEKELLSRVPLTEEASEPAPTESAALAATAPVKPTPADASVLGATGSSLAEPEIAYEPTGVTAVSDVPPVTYPDTSATEHAGLASVNELPPVTSSPAAPLAAINEAPPASSSSVAPLAFPSVEPTTSSFAAPTTSTVVPESKSLPEVPVGTEATAAETGLNAPATSQAQTIPTKAYQLAAPVSSEPSRDVSPMTRPDSSKAEPTTTTGVESGAAPTTTTGQGPVTPQKASKRASSFFRGTPESNRTNTSEVSKDTEGKPKKKGFLTKLKEKFRG